MNLTDGVTLYQHFEPNQTVSSIQNEIVHQNHFFSARRRYAHPSDTFKSSIFVKMKQWVQNVKNQQQRFIQNIIVVKEKEKGKQERAVYK